MTLTQYFTRTLTRTLTSDTVRNMTNIRCDVTLEMGDQSNLFGPWTSLYAEGGGRVVWDCLSQVNKKGLSATSRITETSWENLCFFQRNHVLKNRENRLWKETDPNVDATAWIWYSLLSLSKKQCDQNKQTQLQRTLQRATPKFMHRGFLKDTGAQGPADVLEKVLAGPHPTGGSRWGGLEAGPGRSQ